MDNLSPSARSEIMSRVKARDTVPEKFVRSLVFRLGYRFRLCKAGLPGRPDLAFPSRKKVLFVHGCFWHSHTGCANARVPKSRTDFWTNKLLANKARDARNLRALKKLGWSYLVVWECELAYPETLAGKIIRFLDAQGA